MTCVRSVITAICFLLILSPELMCCPGGQSSETTTKAGPWALLFQVQKNFSLTEFQAGMVSVQRDLCGCAAVRLGAGVYGASSDATGDGSTTDETDVSFTAAYLRYLPGGQDVRVFLGAGPEVGFNRTSSLASSSLSGDTTVIYFEEESKEHSWYVGCGALLGDEWRLTPHIAVTGEYSTSAIYTSTRVDKTDRRRVDDGQWETTWQRHPDTTGWSFGRMEVKLGLTVYL